MRRGNGPGLSRVRVGSLLQRNYTSKTNCTKITVEYDTESFFTRSCLPHAVRVTQTFLISFRSITDLPEPLSEPGPFQRKNVYASLRTVKPLNK